MSSRRPHSGQFDAAAIESSVKSAILARQAQLEQASARKAGHINDVSYPVAGYENTSRLPAIQNAESVSASDPVTEEKTGGEPPVPDSA
jgi:hypothetical protein